MASQSLEQFFRFATDAVGLERILRGIQAFAQILSSFPLAFDLLLLALNTSLPKPPSAAATHSILLEFRQQLGLVRRYFRFFRFFNVFNATYKLYTSASPSGARKTSTFSATGVWVDLIGRTFLGMYLLLESSTLVDAMEIEGLSIWGPLWARVINIEAQRFWFLSLVCAVISGLINMLFVMAHTPVPATGDGFSHGKSEGISEEKEKKAEGDKQTEFDVKKEQERMRKIVNGRKTARVAWRREVRAKLHGLGWSVVANGLDTLLPGAIIGWVQVSPGTVGVAMLVTTVLTSREPWERCGREIAAAR
ncbi:peroxisomal biogenesis factor 11 [Xylariales sp. PMI_506]|nr:peroxisomal biogenesis factor 11 [Xylariales sp. PMI_506]